MQNAVQESVQMNLQKTMQKKFTLMQKPVQMLAQKQFADQQWI